MSDNSKFRILICGGKTYLGKAVYDSFITQTITSLGVNDCEIVSGGCRGADLAGECYAREHGFNIAQFLPEWQRFGKAAGIKRNADMVNYILESEHRAVIAFWNGESRGTGFTIRLAEKKGIKVFIYSYTKNNGR